MLGAVPPLNELFKMNGMELPDYLGKVSETSDVKNSLPAAADKADKKPKTAK